MKKFFVFVYGTLREGETNHRYLKHAELVAEQAWTMGCLYDTGYGYPALISGKERVYGECYKVTKREHWLLDQLEGYRGEGKDNLYNRVLSTIYTKYGQFKAYVYIYALDRVEEMEKISTGDWKAYKTC